ncbi:MAG TPA: hypothetical protein V6D28_08980 [Leptolyngbyaceae cyanobacterium]
MPSIESVNFDVSHWEVLEVLSDRIIWKNDKGDRLSLHFFPIPPNIPFKLNQLTELRNFYRENIIEVGGGLISVDVVSIKEFSAIETIFKFPLKPTGMRYLGSLTFPFADFSYVMKVDCPEYGTTGLRETIVYSKVMQNIDLQDPFKGWFEDPYDPTRKDLVMRNKSEDRQYDKLFSDHPLSRLRKYLVQIENSVRFTNEVRLAKPFN